jgi:hypothetical protein
VVESLLPVDELSLLESVQEILMIQKEMFSLTRGGFDMDIIGVFLTIGDVRDDVLVGNLS